MALLKSQNVPTIATPFALRDMELQAQSLLVRAKRAADTLMVQAEKEADSIRLKARADGLAAGRVDGLKKGLEEGKASGHGQAMADGAKRMADLFTTLSAIAQTLDKHRRDLVSAGIDEVVQLSLSIARKVTKRQAALDPAVLKANLADAMRLAVQAADVRILVHPSQRQLIDDELPAVKLNWPDLKHVDLVPDESVEPGGCRLITNRGTVDAQIETQLERIILEMMPDPATDSPGAASGRE
jgi:flagellar assembly protein FliH